LSIKFELVVITVATGILLHFLYINMEGSYAAEEQAHRINSNVLNEVNLTEIRTQKVQVGEIDIAYKMFGNGTPVLLINGFAAPMNFWDPIFLKELSTNHTVIVFDNRGIGNTTSGEKHFTIKQFADDTAGLLEALKIKKADVVGWSVGGMIAQELALAYPDKIGKLVISSSSCGGIESKPPTQEVLMLFANPSGSSLEKIHRFLPLLFPLKWRIHNPDYLESLPKIPDVVSDEALYQQLNAIIDWAGTCGQLGNIEQPTLVIVGMDDVFAVPANSLLLSDRIPGARLVQMEGGGHGLMFQYPESFSKNVNDFLSP
jgi:pimeloyl-ACP methyl ester carboxylesterase